MSRFFERFLALPFIFLLSLWLLTFVTACACSAPEGQKIKILLNNQETKNEKMITNIIIIRSKIEKDILEIEKKITIAEDKLEVAKKLNVDSDSDFFKFYRNPQTSYCQIKWDTPSQKTPLKEGEKENVKNILPNILKNDGNNLEWTWKLFLKTTSSKEEQWSHSIDISNIEIKDGIIQNNDFEYQFSKPTKEINSCK